MKRELSQSAQMLLALTRLGKPFYEGTVPGHVKGASARCQPPRPCRATGGPPMSASSLEVVES